MSEERLNRLIEDFSHRNLNLFFRGKCENYAETQEDLSQHDDERFSDFQRLGEIRFDDGDRLVVTTSQVSGDLSERSGKRAQYEKAKKILKELAVYDAGFFIFHDNAGSFRFSLVYAQFQGTKRTFSNFRRFTYFVNKDQTNKTFRIRVGGCTFPSLEAVKDAFSVEKVNKEFYSHIARFFYRLTGYDCKREMTLPSVREDDKKTYQEFAVRLIGRAIFCWFLKHKKSANGISLIPESILSSEAVKQNSQYYHSTLEKLFFEVLNTPQEQRHENILADADKIPFLNGGLFEPHKDDFFSGKPLYNLVIPDSWFEQFFEILEQYNFTIDENSTVDADVSVDPEMLGRIFENLLAEVDPATGETARKATGSYYTPRTIVDYMVDQSLKQYLITKTKIDEDKITALLSYEAPEVVLSESEKGSIISALDGIKIIDPACGSGAFPMGILHKMLLVLQKADPDLKLWLKNHLGNIEPGIFKERLLERIRNENWEYVRKLLIIQKSIYGVDIQTIAVEISKLRFFLSLIVDEQIDDLKSNRGVEALPNLEFKFVSANSLIGLPPVMNRQVGLGIVNEEVVRLKELRNKYLRSFGAEKLQIEKEFRAVQRKLFEENMKWLLTDDQAKKLAEWDPFSYETSGWFDPEWMFGIAGGFDIVIANPPYIDSELMTQVYQELRNYCKDHFQTAKGNWDIFVVFIEKGIQLLAENGIITYIVPNKLLGATYTETLRHLILTQRVCQIRDYSQTEVFESCFVYPVVFTIQKTAQRQDVVTALMDNIESARLTNIIPVDIFYKDIYWDCYFFQRETFNVLMKCMRFSPLGTYYKAISDASTVSEAYELKEHLLEYDGNQARPFKKLINTGTIDPYTSYWGISSTQYIKEAYLKPIVRVTDLKRISDRRHKQAASTKIIIGGMTRRLECFYDTGEYLAGKSTTIILPENKHDLAYTIALLNSRLISFWYAAYFKSLSLSGGYLRINHSQISKIPVPDADKSIQAKLSKIALEIVRLKKAQPQADTSSLEHEIDQLVYQLYGLTEEEIGVVERTFRK